LAADLPPPIQIRAWDSAAIVYRWQRDLTRAREFALRALEASRQVAAKYDEAWALRQLGVIAQLAGDLDEARVRYDEAAALFRELDELQGLRIVAHDQACLAIERGDYTSARALLDEALARAEALDWDVGASALELGILALHEKRYDESLPLFVESLESAFKYGRRPIIPLSLRGIAASAVARGDLEPAARMLGAAEGIEEADAWPELDRYEYVAFKTALAPLLDRIADPELAAARAAGRTMSEADAATYALATCSLINPTQP
jgi:tetratricopeptide (TPR) repeat protein